jgi:hypothetical protein
MQTATDIVQKNMQFGFEHEVVVKCGDEEHNQILSRFQNTVDKTYWNVVADDSIELEKDDEVYYDYDNEEPFGAIEFVSKIMKYKDIKETLENLNEFMKNATNAQKKEKCSFEHNKYTSNHVHLSICTDSKCTDNRLKDPVTQLKVFVAWLFFEQVFMSLVKEHRRWSFYCQSYGKTLTCSNEDDYKYLMKPSHDHNEDMNKYFTLNVRELQKINGKGTIEIRIKHGSNDMEENFYWINLLALFFSAAYIAPCVVEKEGEKQCGDFKTLQDFILKHHEPTELQCQETLDYWRKKSNLNKK